jgi:predicted RNase H-like nuclease (RuvC/YqgF family)
MKYLIVGIDPGTTTAVAALDLHGGVVKVVSGRNWGLEKVVEVISEIGRPIVISTDKSKVPAFVEKVCARFKVKLVAPRKDMSALEKKGSAGGFRGHERDAVAAALYAYSVHKSMFKKVEQSIPPKKWNSVKRKLVLDEAINRADALRELVEKEKVVRRPKKRESGLEKEVGRLRAENRGLRSEVERLKTTRTKVVRHITNESIGRLANARLDTIKSIRKKLRRLEGEVEHLQKTIKVWEMGGVPIEDDVKDVETMEMCGIKFISREDFSKVEKKRTQSLLKKIIKSHRSKSS